MKKIEDIPIFLITVIMPLSVLFHIETIDFAKYPWFPNQEYWIDLFLYGKSILLQIAAVMMLIILLAKKIKTKEFFIGKGSRGVMLLAVLFLVSAIFSKCPKESFTGSMEQYEPVGVLLSYLIVFVYCRQYISDEKCIRKLRNFLLLGMGLSCILGLMQLFQLDLWNSEVGKRILIPESFANLREELRFSQDTGGFHRVYMALYNSTYAGIYLVMLLPFLLFEKNKMTKILLLPAMLCLIGTMSKTSWIAVILTAIFGYWLLVKNDKTKRISKGRIVIGAILMCSIIFAGQMIFPEEGVRRGEKKLQQVVGEEDAVRIVYQGNTLYFSEVPKDHGVTYKIVDEEGKEPHLVWVEERGEMDCLDPRFDELHFKVYEKDGIGYAVFRYEDVIFRFTDQLGTGKYEYVSINGKPDEIKEADVFTHQGDFLLNGRGYIWNRVIPLIAEHFLTGTGPDSFLQVFPQDDYVARSNLGYGFFTEILTNAHSLYLQFSLQNGVPAFMIMMVLLWMYIKKCWKFYKHKEDYTGAEKVGFACFLGSIGYLICGITFASSVCTTPMFAVLAGAGWGIVESRDKKLS